jgi:1-acyl-sn-glycerol-3-phosphate acyltransferase
VIFPEGAVHSTPGIHPFRTGAFVAAMEAGVCVVPVAIRGSRTLFRHQSWLPRWCRVDLVIQPPCSAERTDPDAVEHLKEATREAIAQWVDEPLLQG